MSIVKMDMSEYEALKKLEATLEDSLSSERVLRQELADAQAGIIEAMKANEKTVTIIEQVHKVETALVRRPERELWGYLERLLTAKRNGTLMGVSGMIDSDAANYIIDTFFTKQELEFVNDKTITHKGFDEIVKQVQDEVRSEHLKRHGDNLQRLQDIEIKYQDLKRDARADKAVMAELREEVKEKDEQIKLLKEEAEKYENDSAKLVSINMVMADSFASGFGANRKRINKIKKLIYGDR